MADSDERVRIRAAAPADVPDLVAFNAALARETEALELDLARLERGIRLALSDAARARYFVAEADGEGGPRPVACTMVTTELSDWRDGEFWWIQSVYVSPEFRRRGVFSRLFRHIEAQALAQTAPRVVGIRLYVEHDNGGARAIYEHLGLQVTGYHLLERDFVLERDW